MLAADELQELEATLLPTLERHHLRLLAHGLRTLQAIAGRRSGPLPPEAAIEDWAQQQPVIQADPGFADAFLTQMASAGAQLEAIATTAGRDANCEPLALELADLIHWATAEADRRVRPPAAPPAPPPD